MNNEELVKQENNKDRDEFGRLLPGHTANPNGRPKGKTIKERVSEWLETHPDDMEAFVKHFVKNNRDLAWQMLEGRPKGDEKETNVNVVIPIYGGQSGRTIQGHNSNKEDLQLNQEN